MKKETKKPHKAAHKPYKSVIKPKKKVVKKPTEELIDKETVQTKPDIVKVVKGIEEFFPKSTKRSLKEVIQDLRLVSQRNASLTPNGKEEIERIAKELESFT